MWDFEHEPNSKFKLKSNSSKSKNHYLSSVALEVIHRCLGNQETDLENFVQSRYGKLVYREDIKMFELYKI